MASINDVYKIVLYRSNKAGYLGNISPDDFNLLFPRAEIRYYNKEYTQYASTQRISDALSKFKSSPTVLTIAGNGQAPSPSNLFHVDAITHNYNSQQVEVTRVESDRIANNLSSSYDAPNEEFPIYIQYSATFQFYPVTLATANLIYLMKPRTSFWAYTLVSNRPVYNPSLSIDPQWSDVDLDNIIYLMLTDMGINFRDTDLESYALTQSKLNV